MSAKALKAPRTSPVAETSPCRFCPSRPSGLSRKGSQRTLRTPAPRAMTVDLTTSAVRSAAPADRSSS